MILTKEKIILKFKIELVKRGLTRREFCKQNNLDYRNFSHVFTGVKNKFNEKEKKALQDFLKINF